MPSLKSPVFKALIPTVLSFLVLRGVFWLHTFPNPDESYYWLWGQHPDFSYYDHPPFQAWVQGIATTVFGQSFLVLRLPNLLSNGVLFYTYYQIANYLYGKNGVVYWGIAIALLLASPLYFLFLALAWPDHWLITFSLIAAFQLIQFLDGYTVDGRGESRRLYGAAIALGLALLCKYNAVFVGMGCLAAVSSRPQWRSLFRDRRLYLAMLLTLTCLLPIVIWNMQNDFQSFRYYSDRSVDSGGFRLKLGETLGFIAFSIVMLSPVNGWAIGRVLWQGRSATNRSVTNRSVTNGSATDGSVTDGSATNALFTYQRVACWIFIVSTLTLIIVSLVSTALYYWNILAYLLLFPLLPSVFESRKEAARALGSKSANDHQLPFAPTRPFAHPPTRLFFIGQWYGLLFALLLVIHYSVLPLSVFGSADSDPDSRMLFGWDQVAVVVERQVAMLNHPFILTTDYRSASALAYQLYDSTQHDPNQHDPTQPQLIVLAISDRVDQFDFWLDATQLQGRDAIILADDWHPVLPLLTASFKQVSSPETLAIKRFGRLVKNYYVLRGYSFGHS
ncbi:MAG: glycosyltransferase family 39 protein [Leptolyngbyaceae cyanobacterium bins.349]|nr:glycosyltransferase family 39 protein [Leptolyngbyaceae cyanobacterium bins.349]